MNLKKVGIEEFTNTIYPEYLQIFVEEERKEYKTIEKAFNSNITTIFEVIEEERFIGFITINALKDSKYAILDYFAILPECQDKGYGTSAIKQLKEISTYDGIFIEVEKCGLGQDKEENRIRERRVKFYEDLGFRKLEFDLDLYKVIYSTYILPKKDKEIFEEDIIKDIFEIYIAVLGEKSVKENCKLISYKM